MGIGEFLINISADVASCVLYNLSVEKVNRVIGDFMCEFNGWSHAVKVFDECGERIIVSIPDKKYIIYETSPVNDIVEPVRLVDKFFL